MWPSSFPWKLQFTYFGAGDYQHFQELPECAEEMAQYLSTIHVALGLIPAPPPPQHNLHTMVLVEAHIGLSTWEAETGVL